MANFELNPQSRTLQTLLDAQKAERDRLAKLIFTDKTEAEIAAFRDASKPDGRSSDALVLLVRRDWRGIDTEGEYDRLACKFGIPSGTIYGWLHGMYRTNIKEELW